MYKKRKKFVSRLWIVYLFYNIIPTFGISQIPLADMTLEYKLHKRWLNCKSTKLDLVAESPAQPNKCYKWSERAYGSSTYIEIAHNMPEMGKQSVAPIKTYWYKCERFNNGQCSGQVDKVWYFKVYVVESIQLTSLVLNDELVYDLNSGISPSIPPETMDEYNDYRLQGNFTIGDILELPKDLQMLPVSIHYSTNIGQTIPDLLPNIEDWALKAKGLFPQVQQDDISKEYLLSIKAECCGMMSNEFKVKVKRLWIEEFKAPYSNENWNVVLDDFVKDSLSATQSCNSFKWSFYKKWGNPENNNNRSGDDMFINRIKVISGPINSDFGNKYGTIILECLTSRG